MFWSALQPSQCGSSGVKKDLGLNLSCRPWSGYSRDDDDGENLDKGVHPCPSCKFAEEEGDRLIGDEMPP
jgi:hypothetical protein